MLHQVLGIFLRSEVESVRRRMRRVVFGGFIALLLLLAFVFAIVAFFLWLATHYAPWLAALIVVAVLLFAVLLLWAASQIGGRERSRRRTEHQMQAALNAALANGKGETSLATVATALAVGFAVGRGLSK